MIDCGAGYGKILDESGKVLEVYCYLCICGPSAKYFGSMGTVL